MCRYALGQVGVVVVALGLLVAPAGAVEIPVPPNYQRAVKRLAAEVEPAKAKRGEVIVWRLTVELHPGYWTYPTTQSDPNADSLVSRFSFTPSKRDKNPPPVWVVPIGEPTSTGNAKTKPYPEEMVQSLTYYPGFAQFEQRLQIKPDAPLGQLRVAPLRAFVQYCNEENCFPINLEFAAPVEVIDGPATPTPAPNPVPPAKDPATPSGSASLPPELIESLRKLAAAAGQAHAKAEPATAKKASPERDFEADLDWVAQQLQVTDEQRTTAVSTTNFFGFILTAIFWGLISLVTPCVFPMIPITVSVFLKQAEKKSSSPVKLALTYCLTIIVVLGLSAVALLSLFRELSVNPIMNIVLGGVFVFFALSLLGMYEITLPSVLTRFTGTREGKGGLVGTVFMALTFSIISFSCVAPFLGGFGGLAASGQFSTLELIAGGIAFAAAFASPFFVLAIFPSLIKKLPKSGDWLNHVKVVMGFLELAAAFKFLRTAELRLLPTPMIFTYDVCLVAWIALAIFCGLYLLNVYRLHHEEPTDHISPIRMLIGCAFVGLAIYLTPALFSRGESGERQRPSGIVYAWVDSFLLPEPGPSDTRWGIDLKAAVVEARQKLEQTGKRQFIFVDFTGVTCTNCKLNEHTVFPRPEIQEAFAAYSLVQLYTDEVPEKFYTTPPSRDVREDEARANLKFQKAQFGDEKLPLYAVLEVTREQVITRGVYSEGKINDEAAFIEFLRAPLREAGLLPTR